MNQPLACIVTAASDRPWPLGLPVNSICPSQDPAVSQVVSWVQEGFSGYGVLPVLSQTHPVFSGRRIHTLVGSPRSFRWEGRFAEAPVDPLRYSA